MHVPKTYQSRTLISNKRIRNRTRFDSFLFRSVKRQLSFPNRSREEDNFPTDKLSVMFCFGSKEPASLSEEEKTLKPKEVVSIRPISHKLPASKEVWEESYLPLCVVSTPMVVHPRFLSEANARGSDGDDDASDTTLYPLSAVPKCLYCGAPLPTSATHYRPEGSTKILCYLCGEVSSVLLADQQEDREDEYLDPDCYDKVDFDSRLKIMNKKESDDENVEDEHEVITEIIDFRMPVVQKLPKTDEPKNGKHEIRNQQEPSLSTWKLPAIACPPIWWVIVDGTVGNTRSIGATRNYWMTVDATLKKTLQNIPPHVHVGLLTATASRLAAMGKASTWGRTSVTSPISRCTPRPAARTSRGCLRM